MAASHEPVYTTLYNTAVSVDSFKNRLDKFWANEEARFDYKANLSVKT